MFLSVTILQTAAESGLPDVLQRMTSIGAVAVVRALVMALAGIPLIYIFSKWGRRLATSRLNPQLGLLVGKVILYPGLAIVAISVLRELGFSLAPLLGAAGVLGIALGFAAQTSVSNVISGLFLIAERPFVLDDLIQVEDVTGRVMTIDTMSVKLRTLDNRMVRIPNEVLVKSRFVNLTRFPIRRVDILVGAAYREDPEHVRRVLLGVAQRNPMALMEPEPVAYFTGFGESSLDFLFGVWTTQENFFELKTRLHGEVKAAFDAEDIEIPFPHRTLYVGAETDAFPMARTTGALQPALATESPEHPPTGEDHHSR